MYFWRGCQTVGGGEIIWHEKKYNMCSLPCLVKQKTQKYKALPYGVEPS